MFHYLGSNFLAFTSYLGELLFLTLDSIRSIFKAPIRWKLVLSQTLETGFRSQLVVIVTGAATGAVFAAQTYFQFHRVSMDSAVGAVVAAATLRELGPVLTGLMVAGRVGAAMAAEIGTMRVTEQIDALKTLSTDPFKYLVAPRLIAGVVTLPMLVLIADIIGVMGGYLVGVYKLDFNDAT